MAWLQICQGLVVLSWFTRLSLAIFRSSMGVKAVEPTGAAGIITSIMWSAFTAVIIWRSGALSTIVGSP